MMGARNVGWMLAVLFLQGCSSTGVVSDEEIQAQRLMATADTLESASAITKATNEYLLVAEHFPSTSVYPRAVRNAGLLLGSPSNPAANDSASQYWLNKYLALALPPEERLMIKMYLAMVRRITTLSDSLHLQTEAVDSLASVTRKQTTEAISRNRRLQEMEAELQRVSTELKKLKEIDIRISKSRDKNKP